MLFKCYRRWIGGHPQQMNEGRYPHRGKPQTIMIHCGAPHIDTVPSRNRIGCQRVGGYVAIHRLCVTRCLAYLFAPSPTHCLAANRKHAFGSVAHMLRCDQTHTNWNSVPTQPVRSTPEAKSAGTGSIMVRSDEIAISKTQLQDVIAAVDSSHRSADQASRLAIAAAQAFSGERQKLESYSSMLTEFIKRP